MAEELVVFEEHRKVELELAGASVSKILRCYPEATLYVNGIGRIQTGWRWRFPDGRIEVRYESGLRAEPSEWATPRGEGVALAS